MFEYFHKNVSCCLRTFVSFSTRQRILIRRTLFSCLYECFKHHCLVCLARFSALAMKYNIFLKYLLQQEIFEVLFYC